MSLAFVEKAARFASNSQVIQVYSTSIPDARLYHLLLPFLAIAKRRSGAMPSLEELWRVFPARLELEVDLKQVCCNKRSLRMTSGSTKACYHET